jgi:DNA polymerase delta subunit 2
VRVVIAGGSVDLQTSLSNGQPLSGKEQTKLVEPIRELDLALTQLAAAMPVDIMPGPNDPANYSLPQQVNHLTASCLLLLLNRLPICCT